MKFLVLVLVVCVSAAPLGYNLPTGSGSYFHNGICRFGQVRHLDGRCVTPQVYQRSYVYDAPRKVNYFRRPHYIPEPKVERNVVFVRLPEDDLGPEPIIVPPPRQQQVVYVLNKQSEQDQRVIEVPAPPPTEPEVVFVDYEEGENPILPSGEDLHSALTTASRGVGHVVESGGVGGGINSFGSGHALTNSIGSGFESDFGVGIGDFNPITNHHSTHASHHATHTNHHSTPTSHYTTPASHHITPTSHYSTPSCHYTTPRSYYSTPSSHYTTPRSYYSTPSSHYTTPRSYYSTPSSHYTTPRSYYSTPASHYTTPSSLYTTP
ncbi:probable ATP-dependent RNA helicase ddx17 [Penaeus japonicus]|uniref:probable ATP-dependent RNA helicase ddx17 n=1 Tax=Penaeus japonicus TaxID=27405 RepID=UPI001C7118CE|nr:probable ATP-dependent RNA helicase ddx17 [Penaeus japonicus]